MAFTEAATSGKRELVVKGESLGKKAAADLESGRDESLYTVTTLNHLQLSGLGELRTLSPKIGQLGGLLQLILTHNGLQSLPEETGGLNKLKLLDVSHNQLSELPSSLYRLHSLQTLVLGHNCLADATFPPLQESEAVFPNLHHVDLTQNQLTQLPAFVYRAQNISELFASDNSIAVLQPEIGALGSLKQLEMKRNKLTSLPHELASCGKLKSLGLENNPIGDRRLLKLIAQHGAQKPKMVLDYITAHAPKPSKAAEKKKKGKGKKKKASEESSHQLEGESEEEDVEFADIKPVVRVVRPPQCVEVVATAAARRVRPYLVCAVVRGLDLARGEAFKQFITLQTKLHDTVCKRRRVATVATHDLAKLSPPLTYACGPAESISLCPLGWGKDTTAQQFLDHVEANKPERGGGGRGAKPQDPTAAALFRYVSFVDASEMVYLKDSTGTVLSLPPLTNCEPSKIEATSRDLLLEVTSSESLASCKAVMDALVVGMCEEGLGLEGGEGAVCVEQGRVEDEGGQLLVLYPSRTDLTTDKIDVRRP